LNQNQILGSKQIKSQNIEIKIVIKPLYDYYDCIHINVSKSLAKDI